MKKLIKNKRFLLKFCLFNLLMAVPVGALAEYYLVYPYPEFSDQCIFCPAGKITRHHARHKTSHKVTKKTVHHKKTQHHYSRQRGELYVYHFLPVCPCTDVWTLSYCTCCPPKLPVVRSEWGDYVVFSSRPTDLRNAFNGPDTEYSPDLTTDDDSSPEMEIN